MAQHGEDNFWGDRFYNAVEEEFDRLFSSDDSGVTRDKKRARDKIRKSAQAAGVAYEGRQENAEKVVARVVQDALERLSNKTNPWMGEIDWVRIFEVFILEAWPRLQPQGVVRPTIDRIVQAWLRSCGGGPATENAARRRRRGEEQFAQERVLLNLPEGQSIGATLRCREVKALKDGCLGEKLLQVGDEIVGINGEPVEGHEDIIRAINAARPGPIRLMVVPCESSRHPTGGSGGPAVSAAAARGSSPPRRRGASAAHRASSVRADLRWLPPGLQSALGSDGGGGSGGARRRAPSLQQRRPAAEVQATHPDSNSLLWVHTTCQRGGPERHTFAAKEVVLNGEDMIANAKKCAAFADGGIPWRPIVTAIEFFESAGYSPQTLVSAATVLKYPPPIELVSRLVECPVIDAQEVRDDAIRWRTSERVFTLRMAETYACHWVDNANYRDKDWDGHPSWPWLQEKGLQKKVPYMFSPGGEFQPLKKIVAL